MTMGQRKTAGHWTLASVASLLLATAASAQTYKYPSLNIERFSLNPASQYSLIVGMGEHLRAQQYRVGITTQYANGTAMTRVGDEYGSLRLDGRVQAHLLGAYSITDWAQAELQVPVILGQSESALASKGIAPIALGGLGQPLFTARLGLLRQDREMPLNLGVAATVGIPIGSGDALGRDPQAPFRGSVNLGSNLGFAQVGGSLYFQLRSKENFNYRNLSPNEKDTVGHEAGFALAASRLLVRELLRGEIGAISDFALANGGNTTQAYLGVRYSLKYTMELFALAGPAFGSLVGTPKFQGMIGLMYGKTDLAERALIR